MVSDAGINSLGLPSDNTQLNSLAPVLRTWVREGVSAPSEYMKIIRRTDMEAWKVATAFNALDVQLNPAFEACRLSEVLIDAGEPMVVQDDVMYSRVTVKLFNKGLVERDCVLGKTILTKKQKRVHKGDFIVSKIDGKSGAFGYVPAELDGAIVTQDFLVYRVNTNRVIPEYLELVLATDDILAQYKMESSGSTGRKRLQPQVLLKTQIPLPTLDQQRQMVAEIVQAREMRQQLDRQLAEQENKFRTSLFR